jgi:hypothetical protein
VSAPLRSIAGSLVAVSALLGLGAVAMAGEPSRADRAEAYRRHGLDPATALDSRVKATPAPVLAMLQEPGRPAPTAHVLTEAERLKLHAAIVAMPPLHRRVLRERLRTLSFLDGMPNTALTSTVNPEEPYRLFDITINAAILRQNISEWLTQKEQTCFDAAGSPLSVSVDAGTRLDALVYVLLHEATHVVDMCLRITPEIPRDGQSGGGGEVHHGAFTDGVWSAPSVPVPRYRDPLRESVQFYAARGPLPIDRAEAVYASLRRTPFASLYGGRHWADDLAEYVTVFHLTEKLGQPFRIVIRKESREVFAYEPMKSDLVRGRVGQMKRFYEDGPEPASGPPARPVNGAAGCT